MFGKCQVIGNGSSVSFRCFFIVLKHNSEQSLSTSWQVWPAPEHTVHTLRFRSEPDTSQTQKGDKNECGPSSWANKKWNITAKKFTVLV